MGELALAEQYAERFLVRGSPDCTPAFAHALLGRGAARRGDRPAAMERWREAAAILMDGRAHLCALQLGWQCGGKEGRAIAEAACAAMGRPMREVLQELQAAGATFQDGGEGAAVAWAVAWAKGKSGGAAKAGSKGDGEAKASTPRRRFAEAKQMDGMCSVAWMRAHANASSAGAWPRVQVYELTALPPFVAGFVDSAAQLKDGNA